MSDTYEKAVETYNKTKEDLDELTKNYLEEKKKLEAIMASNKKLIEAAEDGFDEDKIGQARSILRINWAKKPQDVDYYPMTKEVKDAIREAIEDSRNGFPHMMEKYFGVKAYEGWNSQREDHQYGYGPRYGSTWFSISLRPDYRKLVSEREDKAVAGKERVAVAYVLKRLLDDGTEILQYL